MNSSGSHSLHNKVHKRLLPFPKRRRLHACIAAVSSVVLGSFSSFAMSLGLGELDSSSFLGQPLNAHIELVSLEGDLDLNSLIVRQVSPEEARNMGVETFYAPYRIDFVLDTSSGTPRILVTSSEPIREPYLSLMVELRWPKGAVYRDYPLLLDPPPQVAARSASPTPTQTVSARPAVATSARPVQAPAPRPTELKLEPLATDDGKYKVKRGDTLSTIAERWREGTSQSRADTMQWLHQNNSHAFTANNINRLMAGAVLQMPNLSAYKVSEGTTQSVTPSIAPLPKTGSGEGTAAEIGAEETPLSSASVGEDAVSSSETRGLLTLGTENRDDKTRELIDMLVRENETLKSRMEKLESSEYLDTLKQLIVLQRQQISDLRQKLGVPDTDANQEMDALFTEIGVNRTLAADALSVAEAKATAHAPVVAASERPEAVLELDPLIAQPIDKDSGRGWLVWLMFGAGLALSALFIGMFTYYRRMVPAKQGDFRESIRVPPVTQTRETRAEPTITAFTPYSEDKTVSLDYDGDTAPIYVHHKKTENWLGDKAEADSTDMDATVREIQDAFEDMVLDEDALRNFDAIAETSLEGMTEQMTPAPQVELPVAPVEVETKDKPAKTEKKRKKDQSSRRPDEEVRMSIAEKMAQYNPDEYRQEMESLGLLELDELSEIDESEEEDVETIVYRAMMFCEFKKYDKARSLVELKMQTMQDARLDAALIQIDVMESEAHKSSKKAI